MKHAYYKLKIMTKRANSLINENSPYLLQHAYNPVDWHPWNDETLRLARESNRMMLVSIGYAACHWCHVMEHESFEDETIAQIMNQHFICIKVDREERPDVDHFFMEAIQLLGIRGGWPLNCFALPDGRPVWGGTYFRKDQWQSVLEQLAALWQSKSADLLEQADQIMEAMKNVETTENTTKSSDYKTFLSKMCQQLQTSFDSVNGGNRGAPKFPMPGQLQFLLNMGHHLENSAINDHVQFSLEKMARGGIYDQIGGGFARYSVDERWHIPHFEKMLYDNAQLISLYAEGFRVFQKPLFETVVRESIAFLQRDLLGPEGAYYSALDADSEGVEGKYYVWAKNEFESALGENATLISSYFGIDKQALWENKLNVPVVPETISAFCQQHGLDPEQFTHLLKQSKEKLLSERSKRIPPALDDKRLLSWNALQISALIKAYVVFNEEKWLEQARHTMHFILKEMRQTDGGLFRTWKNGQAKIPAFLDDYSFLIHALIQLYQTDGNEKYVNEAHQLTQYVIAHFSEAEKPGFAFTSMAQTDLAVRPREVHDNVIPSSNAMMCHNLISLGMFFEDQKFMGMAHEMLERQMPLMQKFPASFYLWAQCLWLINKQAMVVVRGPGATSILQELCARLPPATLTAAAENESSIPIVADKPVSKGLQYWFCDSQGCRLPVQDLTVLGNLLGLGSSD